MTARMKTSVRMAVVAVSVAVAGISLSATASAAPQSTVNSVAEAQQAPAGQGGTAGGKDTWAWD
ncbi:hypothetical protein [Streptomyces sp. NPDC059957]|uniref:hypothetical protein n=1 Tax=unclassified Streptomyces TaxID=2593676 RepID=UPI00364B00EC